jgi:ferrochelatase
MSPRFRDGLISAPPPRTALLLVNLGTPDAPTASAVRRYLAEFLHDYRVVDLTRWLWCPILHGVILPLRSPKVAKKYASIWTSKGSPLMSLSRELAEALQAQLPEFEVRLAMRYGNPAVAEVLRELHDKGMQRLLVLLYPQYSASTVASVHDAVMAELIGWRRLPELRLINDYHLTKPGSMRWPPAWKTAGTSHGRGEKPLISFHGIPQRFVNAGDPYARQCGPGARPGAASDLTEAQWRMTFQSRLAASHGCSPTDKTLEALAREGVKSVDMICLVSPWIAWKPWRKTRWRTPRCSGRPAARHAISRPLTPRPDMSRPWATLARRRTGLAALSLEISLSGACGNDRAAQRQSEGPSCWRCTDGSTTPPASSVAAAPRRVRRGRPRPARPRRQRAPDARLRLCLRRLDP